MHDDVLSMPTNWAWIATLKSLLVKKEFIRWHMIGVMAVLTENQMPGFEHIYSLEWILTWKCLCKPGPLVLHTFVGGSNACCHCVDQYLCNSSPNIHGSGLNIMVWIYVIF